MDWILFLNVLISILFVGGIVIGGAKFIGEYSDTKTNDDKRSVRNKYILMLLTLIIITAVAFTMVNTFISELF